MTVAYVCPDVCSLHLRLVYIHGDNTIASIQGLNYTFYYDMKLCVYTRIYVCLNGNLRWNFLVKDSRIEQRLYAYVFSYKPRKNSLGVMHKRRPQKGSGLVKMRTSAD